MKSKSLKSNHIKLYKRENSEYWQMKIKLPKQKAIRSSTGSKILKESEKIALKYYSSLSIENKIHIRGSSKNKLKIVLPSSKLFFLILFLLKLINFFASFNKNSISFLFRSAVSTK